MKIQVDILGEGKHNLVMLHGWGLNSAVWTTLLSRLRPYFCIHLVDLPGYGASQPSVPLDLTEMAKQVAHCLPAESHVLGWSFGGLLATQLALDFPSKIKTVINVGSSPCFSQQAGWPGMRLAVMENFRQQLQHHYQRTVDRFIALQTLGTPSAKQDARQLRQVIASHPLASEAILNKGLAILTCTDLRCELMSLTQPFLRVYGQLDALVPVAIASMVDGISRHCHSVIIEQAGHAPFLSHPDEFSEILISFIHQYQ